MKTPRASIPFGASHVGGRTLEVFTETPRLNVWLYSKLSPHVRGDVLEIGSGIGNLSRLIVRDASHVVLSDTEPAYLEALQRSFGDDPRITISPYDLEACPPLVIAERRYDAIVAVNVIEHVRDDGALIERLAGLLKPGGKLVVYVPACPFAFGSLDRALGHYRRYTPQSLSALLTAAGLQTPRPAYMNLLGLLGWTINARVLRRQTLSKVQIAFFERMMPFLKIEDRISVPIGLGIYTAAHKAD